MVLLTRPAEENARIAAALEPLGARCLLWPLTRIVPLVRRLAVPEGTEAVLFTSANAVRVFAAASAVRDLPALCVGGRTADCARAAGFARVRSADGDATELARLARESGHRRFFHPRGREAGALALDGGGDGGRDGEAVGLGARADRGIVVEALAVYAAEPAGGAPAEVAAAFADGALGVVTIWSPRNAAILRDWLLAVRPPLGATALLGISAAAVESLREAGFGRVVAAARPDAQAMTDGVAALLRQ
jgi:uroporphyrinogen-III synthase